MPLIRKKKTLDEIKKESEDIVNDNKIAQEIDVKNQNKNTIKNKKSLNTKFAFLYVVFAIVGFGVALLIIALINLGLGRGFTI